MSTHSRPHLDAKHLAVWNTQSSGPLSVFPDGCRDLIAVLTPTGKVAAFFTGLDAAPYRVEAAPGTRYVGVRVPAGVTQKASAVLGTGFGQELLDADRLCWTPSCFDHPQELAGRMIELLHDSFSAPLSIVGDFLQALQEQPACLPRLSHSTRTLRRRITQATGQSPQFWLRLYRARRAGRLLVTTHESLAEIALRTGYSDQAHMTREMQHWFAHTPSALRRASASTRHALCAPDAFTGLVCML